MNKVIVVPRDIKYRNIGNIFADLWYKCCGEKLDILTDTESIPDECTQRIVIGNDAVNHLTGNLYFDCKIPELGIRYGTDEYRVFSESVSGTDYLFFAGGRVRSTIYAVYDYFERYGGCSYFWDGDIIRGGSLDLKGVDFFCKPRFEYRGTRYFAHRSLHRFQAEHWSLEDWKREIDWMLKKRLNMFMLRIGMDDVFQKAFPDIVSYPERVWQSEEAFVAGFSDRSLFWSLEFRGNLRKQLLQYALERDLMHPEDCGTMTHWYSQTPSEFMDEVNPSLLEQRGEFTGYYHKENLVWDIRKDENLENYFRLTKAHIENYGSDRIFHTIGLGERGIALNRDENLRIKQYVYHRIMNYLKEHYPNSKLLVASWDLWLMFRPEEVRALIAQLDPEQSIIFDYTSDTMNETRNFTNWGIVGKFPWIAGIFGGYESHNEFRGNYDVIEKRLKTAKDDPMCKGLVYWPELSHGDTLVLEYFSQNAWCEDVFSVDSMLEKYCRDRYVDKNNEMLKIWREFMPVLQMYSWSMEKDNVRNIVYSAFNLSHVDFSVPYEIPEFMPRGDEQKRNAVSVLKMLSEVAGGELDKFTERDVFDIARTVMIRYLECGLIGISKLHSLVQQKELTENILYDMMDKTQKLMDSFTALLGGHEDFSLYKSLEKLKETAEVSDEFESTLKRNSECEYCRSFIYENAKYLYTNEMAELFSLVKDAVKSGDCSILSRENLEASFEKYREAYFKTPLCFENISKLNLSGLLCEAAEIIESMNFNN